MTGTERDLADESAFLRGAWQDRTFASIADLVTEMLASSSEGKWAYRGQARHEWKSLWPSISRLLKSVVPEGPAKYNQMRMLEQRAITRFCQRAAHLLEPADLPLLRDCFQRYVAMQHFRAPTRLVDWTRSPWVALYFAASSEPDHDACVWRVNWTELELRTYGDRAQAYATTPDLPVPFAIVQFFGNHPVHTVWPLVPAVANNRIAAQQSVFTIGSRLDVPHDVLLAERLVGPDLADALVRYRIPKSLKPELIRVLARMNVSAATLFPGIDGLGLSITEIIAANEPPPGILNITTGTSAQGQLFSLVPPDFDCY